LMGRNQIGILRRQTVLALVDQSSGDVRAGGPTDQALTNTVNQWLKEIATPRDRSSRVEERGSETGASVVSLAPSMPAVSDIEPLLQSSAVVQFGPLSLQPAQLLKFILSLFVVPPMRTISGTVLKDGTNLMFVGRSTCLRRVPFWSRPEKELL